MQFLMALAGKATVFLRGMTDNILMIYTEKGIEPFKKPLMFALPSVLILYGAVYSPLGSKLAVDKRELDKVRLIVDHYDEYKDAKARLAAYQRRLPLIKDKEEWLNFVMTSTAKTHGIVFDSLSAQTETEVGGFLLVSREVAVTTTYAKFGKWVADIESSPIMLKVADVTIKKDSSRAGWIKVTMKLSTVFARSDAAAGAV
ncbi:MAG: type 4a pilus biogenesis protein PilO [Elusimicrobiales bacterium]